MFLLCTRAAPRPPRPLTSRSSHWPPPAPPPRFLLLLRPCYHAAPLSSKPFSPSSILQPTQPAILPTPFYFPTPPLLLFPRSSALRALPAAPLPSRCYLMNSLPLWVLPPPPSPSIPLPFPPPRPSPFLLHPPPLSPSTLPPFPLCTRSSAAFFPPSTSPLCSSQPLPVPPTSRLFAFPPWSPLIHILPWKPPALPLVALPQAPRSSHRHSLRLLPRCPPLAAAASVRRLPPRSAALHQPASAPHDPRTSGRIPPCGTHPLMYIARAFLVHR